MRFSSAVASLLLLVLVALLAGCGRTEANDPPGLNLRDLSDFQRIILEDGKVSFEEYESAVFGMVACLKQAGVTTLGPFLEPSGTFYSFDTLDPPPEAQPQFDQTFDACDKEYLSAVELGWADENVASPEEEAAFYDSAVRCLQDAGIEIDNADPANLTLAFDQDPDAYVACFNQAELGTTSIDTRGSPQR